MRVAIATKRSVSSLFIVLRMGAQIIDSGTGSKMFGHGWHGWALIFVEPFKACKVHLRGWGGNPYPLPYGT